MALFGAAAIILAIGIVVALIAWSGRETGLIYTQCDWCQHCPVRTGQFLDPDPETPTEPG